MPSFTETFVSTLNVLQVLIGIHPPKKWDWKEISANPNLTVEIIKKNKNKKLNWEEISANPAITMEIVKAHPLWPWNIKGLSQNPNLTADFVKENLEEDWNWGLMAQNENMEIELIELCVGYLSPSSDLHYSFLSFCENLTIEFVKKHIDKNWVWEDLSANEYFATPEIVEANPDLPWNWESLSSNKNFTMEYIETHPELPWSIRDIFMNGNLTAEFMKKHMSNVPRLPNGEYEDMTCVWDQPPQYINEVMKLIKDKDMPIVDWDWWGISQCVPIQFIEDNPDLPWNWKSISMNENLTTDFLEAHITKHTSYKWSWNYLSKNPGVTMDFVEKHQETFYKWDWDSLSKNPNITFDFIQKHSEKLDFEELSKNTFSLENKKNKKKRDYALLEKERTLPKMANLHIVSQYM